MRKKLFIIVPILAVVFCSFFLLTPLDKQIYDIFLRTLPSLTEDPSVLIVKIDDPSIENVGLFPWTRDIMANAIVFLKEMGAESVTFDLSYLDKSPFNVDPNYIKNELPTVLDNSFNQIDEVVSQVLDGVSNNDITSEDSEEYKIQFLDFNQSIQDSISESISYVSRDIDAYFAKTLKYFGNSYLTLTMVTENDIISEDKTFNMSGYNVPYLENFIALKNVISQNDTKTPEQVGMIPSLDKLLKDSKGAGFVNAEPDEDGIRRRVHLLMKYNGKYYGQLTFVPLLEKLGNPSILVDNNNIVLKDAKVGNITKDIKIPRTEDGSVLIKWPKKLFKDYNTISAWELIKNDKQEDILLKNLREMESSGFFNYWKEDNNPINNYDTANYIKELLLEDGEKPEDEITFENYLIYRTAFIDSTNTFLNGSYQETLLSTIPKDDEATRNYIDDYFKATAAQYSDLIKIRDKVSKLANNAFSIVGIDATSMTDSGQTTFQELYPNVGIHSVVPNLILSEEFLDDALPIFSIIFALILSVGLGLIINKFTTNNSLLLGLGVAILSVLFQLVIFVTTKTYIGVIVPLTSVVVTFLVLSAINFLTTIKEKSFLRSAFSRYLSPEVIKDIIDDPSKLNLGGEKREMTALFTDIQGFSTIAENLDPADLVKLLNMYLTKMSNIVMENRGTIDKYEGDAIIAFFGAPIFMEDHAVLACKTAIQMKKAEEELNEFVMAENLSNVPLFTRIGVNTGDMIVGNMGTPNKMDYTIMGHSVNLAARLEGVNKQYNTGGLLISEYTRAQIGDNFLLRRLDRVRVVGINTPIRLYELNDILEDSAEGKIELNKMWEVAIDLYEEKKFSKALDIFKEIKEHNETDNVAKLYIKRCEEFIKTPPQNNWDGVFNLSQK